MKKEANGKGLHALRNNYLPAVITALFILIAFSSTAQVYQNDPAYGRRIPRYAADTTLLIPTVCGTPTLRSTVINKAAIAFDSCNHKFYFYDPKTLAWDTIVGGSGISGGGSYTASDAIVLQGSNFKLRDTTDGAGTKLMWLSNKGAFRAGATSAPNAHFWDYSNIGINSFAANGNSMASGTSATAFGSNSQAIGNTSFIIGESNTGNGYATFSSGISNVSNGHYSTTIGGGLKSQGFLTTSVGYFNDSTSAANSIAPNVLNRAFEIGVGTNDANRANAMTVLYNGNVGIGTISPTSKFHLNGTFKYTNGSLAAGNYLQSDASGNASWQTFPTIPAQFNAIQGTGMSLTGTYPNITFNATGSSMVYPGAGIPLSTGSAWGTSITDNSANWNTAHTDRLKWDGGATGLVAATGRTSLGLGTLATQSATITDYLLSASAATTYIPYTGATSNVNIGVHNFTADDLFVNATAHEVLIGNTSSYYGQKFQVKGSGFFYDNIYDNYVQIYTAQTMPNIQGGKVGTGGIGPLAIQSGGGNLLIGTTTDNSVDKLQVNGSILSSSFKKVGGLSTELLRADGNVTTDNSSVWNTVTTKLNIGDTAIFARIEEVRKEIHDSATTVIVNTPLTYTAGAIGISESNTTTPGFLSSVKFTDFDNKEPGLGNPSTNGYVLSSTTAGVRSWIAPATGTGTVTNIATGWGNLGGPITNTGTIITDSSVVASKTYVDNKNNLDFKKSNPFQTLTDGATTTWTFGSGVNAKWTMAGSRTLAVSGDADGDVGILTVTQDATGGRTISFPGGDDVTGVTQNTTASTTTTYSYIKVGSVRYWKGGASAGGGSGTVTNASVVSANGFAGTVATASTTPAITLSTTVTGILKGNGTAISAAVNSDLPAMSATVGGAVPTPPNNTTTFLRGDGTFAVPSGIGDMVLATAQTNSGLKTFLAGTLGLRNVANTFTSTFTNTATAARTYTLKDADGTIAFTSDITGTNSGTNTGDNSANTTYASDYRAANFVAGTNYQAPITLTTTGTSGAATFIGGTLNIPNYATGGGGGSGTVTSVSDLAPLFTTATPTTTPTFSLSNSSAFKLFGRAGGTGAPSYLRLDSMIDGQAGVPINVLENGTTGKYEISMLTVSAENDGYVTSTQHNYWNAKSDKINSFITLTDGSTTTWDYNTGINSAWTIAGNRTLAITSDVDGDIGLMAVTQDATGGRTISFPGGDDITGVTQVTTANAITTYSYIKKGSVRYWKGGATGGGDVTLTGVQTLTNKTLTTPTIDATVPTAAATNTIQLFNYKIGGSSSLGWVDENGVDNAVQSMFARNAISVWSAAGNSTTITAIGGAALTATGTATAANVATTNRHTQIKRLDYLVTTAATTAVAGFRSGVAQNFIGNTTGSGGFHFICRFGPATGVATTTHRLFVGMAASTAAPTDVEPSTLTNMMGVGYDAADANLQLMANDGTGAAVKIDLGIAVPTVDRTSMYELALAVSPNSSVVTYTVKDLKAGGLTVSGTVGADKPAANTLITPRGYISAGGTSSVIGIALNSLYIETDY